MNDFPSHPARPPQLPPSTAIISGCSESQMIRKETVVGKLFWKYWLSFFQSWLKLTLQFSPAKWSRKNAVLYLYFAFHSSDLSSNFEAQSPMGKFQSLFFRFLFLLKCNWNIYMSLLFHVGITANVFPQGFYDSQHYRCYKESSQHS